ncbi:hypothetical protein K461DRAFT_312807 [Myriangium duriaei CBS 260.36]|uniref:Aminoglycoside phosphotransferase domain-containing protein n=1 Tax=Myriangium duriaei CBS 260.36 TaxID=1168546 RepID=A0A9P4J0W1_9PEZI|nr:hypothetical protein K461DRAFT_312807 [Myriangium duriaei CBS 260.36]
MASNPINSNDDSKETRAAFVRELLGNKLNLELRHMRPVAYEENFPFPYNHFVYAIEIDAQSIAQIQIRQQPGVQKIPSSLNSFILRLSNPAAKLNDKNIIENEVVALVLARGALARHSPHLVPRVFGWGSAADSSHGWILEEHMPGKPLSDDLSKMNGEDQRFILGQLADVVRCFQQYKLPQSIQMLGGLSFDASGAIVSSQLGFAPSGPYKSYEEGIIADMHYKLALADEHPRLNGWRDRGLRPRLNELVSTGIETLMLKLTKRDKTLVHGDLSMDNIHYDPATKRLSAVLDFTFAVVGTPNCQFLRSFNRGIGRVPGPYDECAELVSLRKAMLGEGFPEPLPTDTDEVKWSAAKAWHDQLEERDMYKPTNLPGLDQLTGLVWLSEHLLPFKIVNEVVVGNSTEEQLARRKAELEVALDKYLTENGF